MAYLGSLVSVSISEAVAGWFFRYSFQEVRMFVGSGQQNVPVALKPRVSGRLGTRAVSETIRALLSL